MTKLKVMVFIHTWMVHNIKDNGKRINNMVRVRSLGLMERCMKAITFLVRNMDMVNSYGQMVLYMWGNFSITTLKVMVNINGQMAECLMATGVIIKCMVEVYSIGLIIAGTKENI